MKKILTAVVVILFLSCKKDDVKIPSPVPVGNPNNKMEADIAVHGQNKHMLSDYTTLARGDYNFTARFTDTICLVISGNAFSNNGDPENGLSIYLTNIKDTGTYIFGQLDSGKNIEILYTEPGTCGYCIGPYYLANSDQDTGQLTIESISGKKIKGRFQGTGFPVYYNDSSDFAIMSSGSFEGEIP